MDYGTIARQTSGPDMPQTLAFAVEDPLKRKPRAKAIAKADIKIVLENFKVRGPPFDNEADRSAFRRMLLR